MTAPLCFIDTETTGVHPEREVWEVAMIRRDDEGQDEVNFFVDVDLSQANPFGLQIGRFYDRHPHGRFLAGHEDDTAPLVWSPAQVAELVACWTHGAHLVGAVPNFDAETLAPLLRQHRHIPAWHYHLIDVEALAIGYLAGSDLPESRQLARTPPWNSDEISRACGAEPASEDERHTALGDARWAMRLYDAIVGGEPK